MQIMELFSWRGLATGLDQQSNMYGKLPFMCSIIYFWFVTNTTAYPMGWYRLHLLILPFSIVEHFNRRGYATSVNKQLRHFNTKKQSIKECSNLAYCWSTGKRSSNGAHPSKYLGKCFMLVSKHSSLHWAGY